MSSIVKPIHAHEGECIDIHWHTTTGIFIERRTCPPKATREVKQWQEDATKATALTEMAHEREP